MPLSSSKVQGHWRYIRCYSQVYCDISIPILRLIFVIERRILLYVFSTDRSPWPSAMPTKPSASRQLGSLNRHPERVRAAWFQTGAFFDARDWCRLSTRCFAKSCTRARPRPTTADTFRRVPPHVLSSPGSISPGRASRVAAASARTQGRPQAHCRDHELHRTAISRRIRRSMLEGSHGRSKPELKLAVHPRSIERALARKKKPRIPPPR